jgi:Transcriptional regulator
VTGVGIALVPKLSAKDEVATGVLMGLSVSEMKLERKLNIIYRKNSVLSHAAQEFLKVAAETGIS